MLNIFRKRESVSGNLKADITDLLLQQLLTNATAIRPEDIFSSLSAISAIGIVQRMMLAAKVEGTKKLKNIHLAQMARDFMYRGESLWYLNPNPIRGSYYTVTGNHDPDSWRYDLTLPSPSDSVTMQGLDKSDCLHIIYQQNFVKPWEGISPLRGALGSKMLSALESSLGKEADQNAVGQVIPVPSDVLANERHKKIASQVNKLLGKTAIVPSTQDKWKGTGMPPKNDWKSERLGIEWPSHLVQDAERIGRQVFAAVGVPFSLGSEKSDGASMREGYRQLVYGTGMPLANLISEGWERSTGERVSINFDSMMAADVAGRARSFGILVGNGVPIPEAMVKSGLMQDD